MSALPKPAKPAVSGAVTVYPESDGKPMADNSKQLRWILVLFGNLSALFRAVGDVLVGGNMFWYAVDDPGIAPQAPDVFVVFGRPKGDRGSYQQWLENDVPMTVVIEVLSPGNAWSEMDDKLVFYEEHGAEEYYVYDPDANTLKVFVRQGDVFRRVRRVQGFVSPRLGIRFEMTKPEMTVFYPDGRRFLPFEELEEARVQAQHEADQAREQAKQATQRADQAMQRADQATQRADQATQRADQARQVVARLGELSRKARHGQASAAELQELERLEEQAAGNE